MDRGHIPCRPAIVRKGGEECNVDDFVGLAVGVLELDDAEGRLNAFS